MYQYVTKAQVAKYKSYCLKVLAKVQKRLKKEDQISVNVNLIGSGAGNMVTRNGEEAFDLDFNLILSSVPEAYQHEPGKMKGRIRKLLDDELDERFSFGQDSTASITYLCKQEDEVVFHFDVALIQKTKSGRYSRLIHDKKQGIFLWNEIRDFGQQEEKVTAIRKAGLKPELRKVYLEKKNNYLKQNDENHPSFVIYMEAVNQVYQKIKKEG